MELPDSDIDDVPDFSIKQNENFCLISKILFLFFTVMSFVSCSKEQVKNKEITKTDTRLLDAYSLKEAKYSDISVPLGYKFVQAPKGLFVQAQENSDYLSFVGNFSIAQTLDFYIKNMELFGWEVIDFSAKEEGLLVCNKLNKSCVISIRENKNDLKNKDQTFVYMFVRQKGGESKDSNEKDINSKSLLDEFVGIK